MLCSGGGVSVGGDRDEGSAATAVGQGATHIPGDNTSW